jgi:hypothetical protein
VTCKSQRVQIFWDGGCTPSYLVSVLRLLLSPYRRLAEEEEDTSTVWICNCNRSAFHSFPESQCVHDRAFIRLHAGSPHPLVFRSKLHFLRRLQEGISKA